MHCLLCAEPKPAEEVINLDNEETKYKELIQKLKFLNDKYVDDLSKRPDLSKIFCFCCCESLHNSYEFLVQVRDAQIKLDAIYPLEKNATANEKEILYNIKIEPVEYKNQNLEIEIESEEREENIKNESKYQNVVSKTESEVNGNLINNNSLNAFDTLGEIVSERTICALTDRLAEFANNFDLKRKNPGKAFQGGDSGHGYDPLNSFAEYPIDRGIQSWKEYCWTCGICFNGFPDIGSLRSHSLVEHMKCAKFACFICKETSDYNNFVVHAKSHHRSLLNRCHHCDATVESEDLSPHINQHLQSIHVCPKCGESFVDNTSLQWHLDYIKNTKLVTNPTKRKDTAKITKSKKKITEKENSKLQNFPCPICSKVFRLQKSLTIHKKIHGNRTRDHACYICGKAYYDRKYLKRHLLRHSYIKPMKRPRVGTTFDSVKKKRPMEKNHICSICNRPCSSVAVLKNHMETHNSARQRDHTCEECGQRFYTITALLGHQKLKHTDECPFVCDICNSAFKIKAKLRAHIKTHSAIKPYSCEICGRNYREQRHLYSHKVVHTDSFPYSCRYCNKGFNFVTCMTRHERQHTGVKPYSCDECSRAFTEWGNYNKHMKRIHDKDMSKKKRNLEDNRNSITENIIKLPKKGRKMLFSCEPNNV